MKIRNILLAFSAVLALACLPSRVLAQAGTETLTIIDSSCTTTTPCTLQLYKAQLAAGATSCPTVGGALYAPLTTTALGTAIGTVNTSWTYTDSTLAAGSTYCYYATVTYPSGGVSPASAAFEVAIPIPVPAAAPVITGTFQAAS